MKFSDKINCPPFLKQGDLVAITSPAKYIDPELIDNAANLLRKRGYKVWLGENVTGSYGRFSGSDQERSCDFQKALDNEDVKAIICSRGGYGSVRLLDRLDWSGFRSEPKWICGFSDITVFHNLAHLKGSASVHSTVPLDFPKNDFNTPLESLFDVLEGTPLHYKLNPEPENIKGGAKACVTGGNLSVFTSLIGTKGDIDTRGKILFLEEVSEYDYKVDRMLNTLKYAGKLDDLAGLIIGGFSNIKTSDRGLRLKTRELITEKIPKNKYPVCFNFPAGHIEENMAFPFGEPAEMNVEENNTYISFTHGRS